MTVYELGGDSPGFFALEGHARAAFSFKYSLPQSHIVSSMGASMLPSGA